MKYFIAFLNAVVLVALCVGPGWAEVKPGDKAQNMLRLPAWTMDTCGTAKTLKATYEQDGAVALKKADADYDRCLKAEPILKEQLTASNKLTLTQKEIITTFEEEKAMDAKRIQKLITQQKKEIAEKNKYKYKADFNWLGWVISGAALLVAAGFAVGFGVAWSKEKSP